MRARRFALLIAALTAAATTATTVPPATGSAGPPARAASGARAGGDYGEVRNILPPGSNGTATAADVAALAPHQEQATPTTPRNFADQLETYDALTRTRPGVLDGADVDRLFKDASFTPDRVVSQQTPKAGVRIVRDSHGVPFITGDTFADTEYGAGYATVQDRMFLMDVLRHTGAARLAEFAGDTPANVAMDRAQLRLAAYTPEEAAQQVLKAARDAGPAGDRLLTAVDSYLAGVNAAQDALCPPTPLGPNVAAPSCPAEYAALQKLPEDWTRADIVYVASLVGGIFGKGGGAEFANSQWYQRLVARFGGRKARRVYDDLREENDPEAPTTSSRAYRYQGGGLRPGLAGVAMPDLGGRTSSGTGDDAGAGGSGAAPLLGSGSTTLPNLDVAGMDLSFALRQQGMSNALVASGKLTRTGRPMAVFGPQTGYYTPQLLVEQVLMGPGIRARGVAFAGTNLFVQLGHGVDYAWSATSAGSDNVDTVVSRLCNRDGSRPTLRSTAYRVGSRCVPMRQRVHTETTTPGATSQEPPRTYRMQVLLTREGGRTGIVQFRTTVKGRPVAVSQQRSTYGHEVDSVLGFSQLNDPRYTSGPASFRRAASHIDYTFNWFYADSRHVSYFSSGLIPTRSQRVEPDLPRWSGRANAWTGWLPTRRHPHQTDPDRGYLVSWNNKQAPGFGAADEQWGYGSVYRSLALERRLKAATSRGRKVGLPQLVGVMSGAATADTRAATTLPLLLKVIGRDRREAAAVTALRSWARAGAPRVDRDRDGAYGHQQAIAIFDDWWQHGRRSVAYDVMKGRLGSRLVHRLPQALDDHPRKGIGSAWNGIAWYGYVNKELRDVLGKRVRGAYAVDYCGRGSRARCRSVLRASLAGAVDRVLAEQGVSRVSQLTYDKHQDDIRSVTAGVVSVRPIDWQNRPTFQQVVAYTRHR